jgi:hypothetical protein
MRAVKSRNLFPSVGLPSAGEKCLTDPVNAFNVLGVMSYFDFSLQNIINWLPICFF